MKQAIRELGMNVPIHIGSSGITKWSHYIELLAEKEINAVSVTNVHHMSEKGIDELRRRCVSSGIMIRRT